MKRVSTAKTTSGKLRHLISIQADVGTTQDSFGAETVSWLTQLRTMASIDAVPATRGDEFVRGQQIAGESTHKITMRHWPSLTRKHRVLFGTRVFDINSVRNVGEQSVFQEIYCKEAV